MRKNLVLNSVQQNTLNQVMEIIETGEEEAVSIIADLCPNFGKTVWSLSLFGKLANKYGHRVMLIPAVSNKLADAYAKVAAEFSNFSNMEVINTDNDDAEELAWKAVTQGKQIVVIMSLHGKMAKWTKKHNWLQQIDNNITFMFAHEDTSSVKNDIQKVNYVIA